LSSTLPRTSAIALSNNTPVNITTVPLTAGDWDVTGQIYFIGSASTLLINVINNVGTTSAGLTTTLPGQFTEIDCQGAASFSRVGDLSPPPVRPFKLGVSATSRPISWPTPVSRPTPAAPMGS